MALIPAVSTSQKDSVRSVFSQALSSSTILSKQDKRNIKLNLKITCVPGTLWCEVKIKPPFWHFFLVKTTPQKNHLLLRQHHLRHVLLFDNCLLVCSSFFATVSSGEWGPICLFLFLRCVEKLSPFEGQPFQSSRLVLGATSKPTLQPFKNCQETIFENDRTITLDSKWLKKGTQSKSTALEVVPLLLLLLS